MADSRLWMAPVLVLAHCAQSASAAPTAATDAVRQVRLWIEAKECGHAVRELNAGLAKGYPELALLAGAMYEEGTCLKRDWNRAAGFYVQANEGGQRAARYRLASGYAAPAGGPDIAAALWWANQRGPQLVPACGVSEAAGTDPDRFVAELQTWQPARLQACNYAVGVISTLAGDMEYPEMARAFSLTGTVRVHFLPSIPRVDVKSTEAGELQFTGVDYAEVLIDRKGRSVTGAFQSNMRQLSDRALKRYPQPAGIDPALAAHVEFVFSLE